MNCRPVDKSARPPGAALEFASLPIRMSATLTPETDPRDHSDRAPHTPRVLASAIERNLLSPNGRIIKSDGGKSPPKNIHKGLFLPFQSAMQAPIVAKRGARIIQVVIPITTISGPSIPNIIITPFRSMCPLTGLEAVKGSDPNQTPLPNPPSVC